MTMPKLANLLLFFILIASVGFYCVLGNQGPNKDISKMKMRRDLMGFNIVNHLLQSPDIDCETQPCDPTLDHCKDIGCGICIDRQDGSGTFGCNALPDPSENCLEEECIDETDEECFVLGCLGGCDTDSLRCKIASPEPEQTPESGTVTEQEQQET